MEAIIYADIANYLALYPFLPSSLLKNPNFALGTVVMYAEKYTQPYTVLVELVT